jgi:hypothetical protein
MPELNYIPCCNESCFTELRDFIGLACFQDLQDRGMFEYSSIQGLGLICKLLDIAKKYNISSREVHEILVTITEKGLVVHCSPDGTNIVASVESWVNYADAVGITQSPAVIA